MTPLEHRMLRQILTNQFWLLKVQQDNAETKDAYLTSRLDNTNSILNQAYALAREDREGSNGHETKV